MATNSANVVITAEDKTAAAFNSVKEKLSGLQGAVQRFKSSLVGGLFEYTAIMSSIHGMEELGKAVYDNTVVWQGMEYTLQAAGLSVADSNKEMQYLEATCLKLGLNIKDVSSAFSRFILTGSAAGESLPALNEQFTSVSEAMRVFHLSNQQATRSWLALTEIMAMGKVQSRQFTQQLGRDWPGIGALIANALFPGQDSMKRFYAAMEEGKISSQEFMDGFNKLMASPAMQGALNDAIDSIQAAMGRFQTTLFNFFNEADNPAALDSLKQALNDLSATLNDPAVKEGFDSLIAGLIKLVSWGAKAVGAIGELGKAIGTDLAMMVTGTDTLTPGLASINEEIAKTKSDIKELSSAGIHITIGESTTKKLADLRHELVLLEQSREAMLKYPSVTYYGSDAHKPLPILPQPPALSDASAFAGAPSKKSQYEQWADSVSKLNEQLLQLKNLQSSQTTFMAKMHNTKDTHQVAGAPDAIEALKSVADKSPEYLAQVQADIKSMVGQTVNGVTITAQMADKAMQDFQNKADKQTSEFAKQAQRNIQDSFAQLFTHLDGGWRQVMKNMLKSFQEMAAQIIAQKLLGNTTGGTNGTGTGLMGLIGTAMKSWFGGSGAKAGGGFVSDQNTYLVGENGPELFSPGSSGYITPNHALAGAIGGNQSYSVNIDARGAGPDETAKIMRYGETLKAQMQQATEYRIQRGTWMRH